VSSSFWLEEPAPGDRVHAGAGVVHLDLDGPARRPAPDAHRPPGRGGVHRVLDEVHQHLAELAGIAAHLGHSVEVELHPHLGRALHGVRRLPHDRFEPHLLPGERPVADHVEQVGDDAVGDAELLADAVDVLPGPLVRVEARAKDVERGLDDAEIVPRLEQAAVQLGGALTGALPGRVISSSD